MTKEELIDKIGLWEQENGESFIDYFVDDNVALKSWLFWLLGKGFHDFANPMINEIAIAEAIGKRSYFDQEGKWMVYPEYTDDGSGERIEGNYNKSIALMSEFLLSCDLYRDRISQWLYEQAIDSLPEDEPSTGEED